MSALPVVLDTLHEERHLAARIGEFPELAAVLARDYRLEHPVGRLRLFRHVGATAGAPTRAAR